MTVVETSNRRDFGGFSIFERILVFVFVLITSIGLVFGVVWNWYQCSMVSAKGYFGACRLQVGKLADLGGIDLPQDSTLQFFIWTVY